MTVRTRFAPSPTGTLHIGGARTSLFNYLLARHHGGQFLIRIEDTDKARSKPEFTESILENLAWLGMTPDEPPIFQSTRKARHREVALQMVAAGAAYLDYTTPEELAQMRAAAEAAGKPFRYDGGWRDRDSAHAPPGIAPAIRLKAPREGETVVRDLVQGEVRVANAELDDMIILRSDGTPTYQHAVVVDDHDMAITHVIRGVDHLTNTFRQTQIYRAMGWDVPDYAHVPLIHGADGAKLSKRHGAISALEFRDKGYLPEALCNYLLRLGWGHGDKEIVSREEAVDLFDLADVGRSPSRMDYAKLLDLNGWYIRHTEDDRLVDEVLPRLQAVDADGALRARLRALMPGLKERAKTLAELADAAAFLGRSVPLPIDAKAAALLTPEARGMLQDVAGRLAETDFSAPALDAALRGFAETNGRKLGQVAQPLRAALTGRTTSPPIDATLAALGRAEALARIRAIAA
ncbi:MAG TPA: glutamate--tRNA ligase [Acetobacteraceae bacterium]|jgi:glutamyl-tRNA synthetase|nr:glutamate--tRNA ligase [Acetobacteraceae bacterium]